MVNSNERNPQSQSPAFVPGFNFDIFVSYASPGQQGKQLAELEEQDKIFTEGISNYEEQLHKLEQSWGSEGKKDLQEKISRLKKQKEIVSQKIFILEKTDYWINNLVNYLKAELSRKLNTGVISIPPVSMSESFHVFLSHNSKDKPTVQQLAQALKARDLKVWLDEEQLIPGAPWQLGLEEAIKKAHTAAVLVGKDGLGPWEIPEMRAFLSEFVDRQLRVIPVLLPGVPVKPELPVFLRTFTWVDLRDGLTDDGLDRLEWGITGVNPNMLNSEIKKIKIWLKRPTDEAISPLPLDTQQAAQSSAVFLVILSDHYLESQSCQKERELFFKTIEKHNDPKKCIFVVQQTETDRERWPQEFDGVRVCSLFKKNREDAPAHTLGLPEVDPNEKLYFDRLGDLSRYLAECLKYQQKEPLS